MASKHKSIQLVPVGEQSESRRHFFNFLNSIQFSKTDRSTHSSVCSTITTAKTKQKSKNDDATFFPQYAKLQVPEQR
jgi:hypothetical protein